MVTQGEYLGESFPETDCSTSLEEGAHLLGEPFPFLCKKMHTLGSPLLPALPIGV